MRMTVTSQPRMSIELFDEVQPHDTASPRQHRNVNHRRRRAEKTIPAPNAASPTLQWAV
jgi:hypothetical protein